MDSNRKEEKLIENENDPKWDKLDFETEWDYYSGLPNPKAYENINS